MTEETKNKINPYYKVLILQCSAVALLLISVIVVKMLGGNVLNDLKAWYSVSFMNDTSFDEVVKPPAENNDIKTSAEIIDIDYSDNLSELEENLQLENALKKENVSVQKLSVSKNTLNTFVLPVGNARISSNFAYRSDPFTGVRTFHSGTDFAVNSGTKVKAAAKGTVSLSQYSTSYGNYIIIEHGNGLQTLYAHCSCLLKSVGQTVKAGDVIALSGSTGRSTGPHLHFEVRLNGQRMNPEWLLNLK